jgi:hypothetical protein
MKNQVILAIVCLLSLGLILWAADNLAVTAGSGSAIATDQAGDNSHMQITKLAYSADGTKTLVTADTDGLEVQIGASIDLTTIPKAGEAWPVTDNGANLSVDDGSGTLTVDAPVGTPVFVRISDGASAVDALPVTDNSSTLSVDDAGGALTVDGTVTSQQGSPAAVANGWPVKITDGTDTLGISTVGAQKAIKVDVVQGPKTDKSTFTEGTTKTMVVAGVYNDTISADPTEDQSAAIRISAKRGLHINLRNVAGTEVGTAADPVEVGLRNSGGTEIGTAAAPVQVGLRDESAAAWAETNPIPVQIARSETTRISTQLALAASQTAATLLDPTASKKFVITSYILKVHGAGTLKIFDETDSASTILLEGTMAVGDLFVHDFNIPWASATVDNILKYTSGAGLAAEISIHGYEVD